MVSSVEKTCAHYSRAAHYEVVGAVQPRDGGEESPLFFLPMLPMQSGLELHPLCVSGNVLTLFNLNLLSAFSLCPPRILSISAGRGFLPNPPLLLFFHNFIACHLYLPLLIYILRSPLNAHFVENRSTSF